MNRRRALVQPVAVGLLVVVTFVGTYLLLLLKPAPHDLRVAIAAPPAAVTALQAALPSGVVTLVPVAGPDAATAAVRHRSVVGAYLPADRTLLVAGAGGQATVQAVTAVFARAGVAQVRDLAPLPAADPRGLAGFYLTFGMVLAAFVFGQTSHLYGGALPARLRVAQTAVVAPVAGVLGALVAGPLTGAEPAPFLLVAAVLTLLVAAVAAVTQAATAALGDAGVLVATLGMLTLGNATSGGAIPVAFLPTGLRQVAEYLPPGAAVRALQNASAFPDAAGTPVPYLVLAAWSAAGLLAFLAAHRRAGRRPRAAADQAAVAPEPAGPGDR